MKFFLDRASDGKDFGVVEINSLEELKQLSDKYRNEEDYAWDNSHSIVIDFDAPYKEAKEQGIDGRITIYDYYVE